MATNPQESYTGTPNTVNPHATQNNLNSLWMANAPASEYAGQYGMDETVHLKRAIYETIVENFPAQYNIFRILFSKPIQYRNSDEYTWTEENWFRPILTATSAPAGATFPATQSIVLTTGGTSNCVAGDSVWYPDGTQATITTVTPGTSTIVVTPLTGQSVPAVVAGDHINVGTPLIADGMNYASHFDRIVTTQHTNYLTLGQRNRRWTKRTLLKYQNSGTTDYIQKDMKLTMHNAQLDVFQQFFNGTKGNAALTPPAGGGMTGAGTYQAKTSWGIYPFMKYSGSQHATSTPATLEADFRQLAFNTNYKNVNVPRFILGTDRALSAMGSILKNPIRYFPENMKYNMNLDEYTIGTMKFVPMVCPLFEIRSGLFPASFETMLLVLDIDTIDPICMKGLQPFEMGDTMGLYKGSGGGYQDFIDYWVTYAIGLQMTNTDSSFYINLNGI